MKLTPGQLEQFDREGYLFFPGLFTPEETKTLTGMLIGGVTVFALPDGLPVYVDERVMGPAWIIVGGGGRSTKIKLAPEALRRLPNVVVVPGLATNGA